MDYTITIENTGRATLYKRNITDTLLGAITTDGVNNAANAYVLTNTCGASLAPDATCTITLRRTVHAGDPDPLPNTVDDPVLGAGDFTGLEFTRTDDHRSNLFQPAVQIAKTGDALSKVTDPVNYTFTITNKSSAGQPEPDAGIDQRQRDRRPADPGDGGRLRRPHLGRGLLVHGLATVAGGDPDPLVNTVNVLYHPVGFPNDITARDGHSVNLFQPSVSIAKTGDALSKIGDEVTYHFKITNTGSADSPDLVLDSDQRRRPGRPLRRGAGGLRQHRRRRRPASSTCRGRWQRWTCTPWTARRDDPVINTVTVHFHPAGFPNDITATASHELNLFQPSITFDKTADTELSKVDDVVNYTLTLNNTSSADTPDLVCTITDAAARREQAGHPGVRCRRRDQQVRLHGPAGAADPLVNTASVSCSPTGFPNVLTAVGRLDRRTCSSRASWSRRPATPCPRSATRSPTSSRSPTPAPRTART